MVQFITDNSVLILAALFAVSEVLSLVPAVQSNGVFQLLFGLLKKAVGK
jgi:hypothetical protein